TARLLMGLLSGQDFQSIITGDDSLSRRPMGSLVKILNDKLGAQLKTSEGGVLPCVIDGISLHGNEVELPVASAQMKSAVLLAGLGSGKEVAVSEPYLSRDHTERMLAAFGSGILTEGTTTTILSTYRFTAEKEFEYHLPGDISSASFLIGAAIVLRKNIKITGLGLNKTRRKFLELLRMSGLEIEISEQREEWNEEGGTVEIFADESSPTLPFMVQRSDVPLLIDEIPMLAVLAAFCDGESVFSGLSELRKKESDRVESILTNLQEFGVDAVEAVDGLIVRGSGSTTYAHSRIEHNGDHRIAMAFSILALTSNRSVTISSANIVSISYPNFFKDLATLAGTGRINYS
ncbi:MAG: 3-phosphoshikimate 1-carboxyvinyltransferase, partial [Ignavibacteriota bacterium]